MCGFAGWVRTGGPVDACERAGLLAQMGRQLARRGPDDQTTYDDGTLALTFRRLAIVDPARGRQPFHDETGELVSVVNGEIYNHLQLRAELAGRHRLVSHSDCEVAVHRYADERATAPDRPSFLDRLNGIFALCVWDRRRQRGLLARDRLGVKPLYVARLADGLLFGSELKALLAHPECPRGFAEEDLDLRHVGTEEYTSPRGDRVPSFVRGVELLGAGEWLTLDPGGQGRPRRYWSLEPALARSAEEPPRPAADYVAEYGELLSDSIRLQLGSDVPVGAFLSGGLDSATLVAAAAARGVPLECFSVSEPTTIATGDVARAAGLARRLHLRFHPVRFDPATFLRRLDFDLAALEEVVWAMDAPRFAPELFFKFELHRYARTVSPELRVMMIGQGADEFAGGYSRSFTRPRPDWVSYEAELPAAGPGAGSRYQAEMRRRLVVLQSHNLWNEDRVAAAHGVEARVPFLDHRLVEYLAAVPPARHAELFFNKRIVREAAARWLPPPWREAPKVGFWQADDRRSVHAVMARCARRAYPEFRESYAGGYRLASQAELDRWFGRAAEPDQDGRVAVQRLLAAMTAAVFDRLCRRLGDPGSAPAPPWRPSRLEAEPAHQDGWPRVVAGDPAAAARRMSIRGLV